MLIEQSSTYSYKLKYLKNPTFDKVRGFAKSFIDDLPKELVDELYSQLERGVVQIDSEPQMLVYLYAFGNMHQAKLNKAFENIPEILFDQPEINIIDYGCGQAIGTMCYVDFIRQKESTRKNTNNTILYRNTKSLTAIQAENNNALWEYGHDNRIGGSHAWFRCGSLFGYVTLAADKVIQEAGGVANACKAGTIQYSEALGDDGKWYPQIIIVSNSFSHKVKRVTLIEPSEICLKRAALHVSKFCPDAEIITVNKEFDDLEAADIVCDDNIPTLHILSNVLDLEFDLDRFAQLINKQMKGYNQFVCVGPYFGYSDKDKRMENLYLLLNGDENFCNFYEKYELNSKKDWTAQIRCFSVANLEENLSTKKTEEDIENGIEDEFGVVYSRDGKRMLKCKKKLEKYEIEFGTKVICDGAFRDCSSLQQITIPNSVTSIGEFAFWGCKSFQQITIPNSVMSIGDEAFGWCSFLQQITLPNSVTSIGEFTFDGCISLQQIIIPEGSEAKFSQMLPNELWDKLYYLKKAVVVKTQGEDDLPF